MGLAQDHRKHAENCFRLAQSARDERHKSLWLSLAQSWLALAQHAAKEPVWSGLDLAGGGGTSSMDKTT
jgi:hypothetical protein